MHLLCCAATCELLTRDRASPRCTSPRAPTGRIQVKYVEDQIQKQSTTLRWTNASYHDEVKNDEKTEKYALTLVFERYDAVETMLAYFNYFQYQALKDAESIVGLIGLRNIMDPMVTEHIYELDTKMIVTVPAYLQYSRRGFRGHGGIKRVAKHQGSKGGRQDHCNEEYAGHQWDEQEAERV